MAEPLKKHWGPPAASKTMADRSQGILLDSSVIVTHFRGKLDLSQLVMLDESLFMPLTVRGELRKDILMNADSNLETLKPLQDAIYRDKVRRARAMTPAERLDEALELSNDIYTWMLDGAKSQCGLPTDEEGWTEVLRRLQTLRRLHERNLYQPVVA